MGEIAGNFLMGLIQEGEGKINLSEQERRQLLGPCAGVRGIAWHLGNEGRNCIKWDYLMDHFTWNKREGVEWSQG